MENKLLGYFLSSVLFSASAHAYSGKDVMSGAAVSFPSASAKATVLVFLSAKCPCSNSHEAKLKALYGEFSKQGFEFVAVHSNQDENEVLTLAHFKTAQLPFPVIADDHAALANEFKALKTPHVFLLKDGKVLFQGGVDDSNDASLAQKNYLAQALSEAASGKPITQPLVRTLGCAIKR